ncbi:MAG: hypothetical protein Q9195_003437 [Heterodermia aff. obscurata]
MAQAKDSDFSSFAEVDESHSRLLPENCVEYFIYIIDNAIKDTEVRQKLRAVQASATSFTKALLKGYIWQRDSFQLELIQEKGLSFLYGKTEYGDSVEDEWLVVYILRELSKKHSHLWVRVADTDGQFLLIEAANALPQWLNPEVADFRVWINQGKLLIIPVEQRNRQRLEGKGAQRKLTLVDACKFIQQNDSKLLHSPFVEAEAFYRLEKYPQQIQNSLHKALITLPRKLACIINQNESYVSAAIEAFYLRDPIALRPLQTSNGADLLFAPDDLITTSIKFTKVGYAQLRSQHFTPPPVWAKCISTQSHGTAQARAESGMKLTSGFEMLISDPQNSDKRQVREIQMLLEDLESGQDTLPTDLEIQKWPKIQDDESWLDISFESLESELQGKGKKRPLGPSSGFGDKIAQENLRKIVARFEDFLNDDAAGADGAEFLDDMDYDDDDQDSSEDEAEDEDLSFDEQQFAAMMKEMMGISQSRVESTEAPKLLVVTREGASKPSLKPVDAKDHAAFSDQDFPVTSPPHMDSQDRDSATEEELEIRTTMEGMERELRDAGALRLNPKASITTVHSPEKVGQYNPQRSKLDHTARVKDLGDFDEEIDIDLNLAQNLLESFKGQAGMAGPGGNLFGMMGVHMPRDDEPDDNA